MIMKVFIYSQNASILLRCGKQISFFHKSHQKKAYSLRKKEKHKELTHTLPFLSAIHFCVSMYKYFTSVSAKNSVRGRKAKGVSLMYKREGIKVTGGGCGLKKGVAPTKLNRGFSRREEENSSVKLRCVSDAARPADRTKACGSSEHAPPSWHLSDFLLSIIESLCNFSP